MLTRFPPAFCILALLIAGTGCHTAQVSSTIKPGTDFSRYKTFNFAEPVASPGTALLSEQNRYSIDSAIAKEMFKRSYVQAQDADLLFAIELQTSTNQYNKAQPSVEGGSLGSNMSQHYGLKYDQSLGSQPVVDYTEGALLVRALDPKQNQVVWEGEAVGVLYKNRPPDQVEARIHEVIKALFKKFPENATTK